MDYDIWQSCFLFPLGFSRIECASWVQAWGSVLAILAIGWLFLAQGRREAKRRSIQETYEKGQQSTYCKVILFEAKSALDEFAMKWRKHPWSEPWDYAATPMVEALDLLKQAIASPIYPGAKRTMIGVRAALIKVLEFGEVGPLVERDRANGSMETARAKIEQGLDYFSSAI